MWHSLNLLYGIQQFVKQQMIKGLWMFDLYRNMENFRASSTALDPFDASDALYVKSLHHQTILIVALE